MISQFIISKKSIISMALRIFFRSKPGKASGLFVYIGETGNRCSFCRNIFPKLIETLSI